MPSHPNEAINTQPFFLLARTARVGCLLVHGFTGTPHEMRFLGEHLFAHGYTVNGVRLAGHGTSAGDLQHCTWRDWYTSVRDAMAALQQHAPRSVVVGQSLGALLAIQLAVEEPATVAGMVLLSPALVLSNRWLPWISTALPLVLRLVGRHCSVGKGESDIADAQARADSPSYRHVPLAALHQLVLLQKHARAQLPRVRQPVLVLHSRQDHTCPAVNVDILRRSVRGPLRVLWLHDSYHVVSVDVDKERVAAAVAAFVDGIEPPARCSPSREREIAGT
ncbi:MAG: alpha/beta hydrolase [Candidatus Binatia bacterium]